MFKLIAAVLVLTSLLGASPADPEKPTPDQIRQAKLQLAAQNTRLRNNNRAQRKFAKAQRKAWKRSVKPHRRNSRSTR